jgi:hypothetical protein
MPLFDDTSALANMLEAQGKNRLSLNMAAFFLEVIHAMNPMKTFIDKLKACEGPSFPFLSFKKAFYTKPPTDIVFVNYNTDIEGRLIPRSTYAYENEAKLYDLLDCLYVENDAKWMYDFMTSDPFFSHEIMGTPIRNILNDGLTIPLIETMLGEGFQITMSAEAQDALDIHQHVQFVTYSVSYVKGYKPFFSSPNPFPLASDVAIDDNGSICYPPGILPSWLPITDTSHCSFSQW